MIHRPPMGPRPFHAIQEVKTIFMVFSSLTGLGAMGGGKSSEAAEVTAMVTAKHVHSSCGPHPVIQIVQEASIASEKGC